MLEGTKTWSKVWPFGTRVCVLITVLRTFSLYETCHTVNSLFINKSTYLSTYSISVLEFLLLKYRKFWNSYLLQERRAILLKHKLPFALYKNFFFRTTSSSSIYCNHFSVHLAIRFFSKLGVLISSNISPGSCSSLSSFHFLKYKTNLVTSYYKVALRLDSGCFLTEIRMKHEHDFLLWERSHESFQVGLKKRWIQLISVKWTPVIFSFWFT